MNAARTVDDVVSPVKASGVSNVSGGGGVGDYKVLLGSGPTATATLEDGQMIQKHNDNHGNNDEKNINSQSSKESLAAREQELRPLNGSPSQAAQAGGESLEGQGKRSCGNVDTVTKSSPSAAAANPNLLESARDTRGAEATADSEGSAKALGVAEAVSVELSKRSDGFPDVALSSVDYKPARHEESPPPSDKCRYASVDVLFPINYLSVAEFFDSPECGLWHASLVCSSASAVGWLAN